MLKSVLTLVGVLMAKDKGHSWISNGLDSKVTPQPVEEDTERIEGELTDFNEVAKISQETGVAINPNAIRNGSIAW